MPSRLSPLMLALLLCLAGCSGAPGIQPADSPQGPNEAATSTAEPVAFPDGPKSQPDRPDELTEESVREYVRTLQYRISYNSLWDSDVEEVNLKCWVEGVENDGEAFTAEVSCSGSYTEYHGESETQEAIYDLASLRYRYFVSSNSTRRTAVES
jgi:hypothetical protein